MFVHTYAQYAQLDCDLGNTGGCLDALAEAYTTTNCNHQKLALLRQLDDLHMSVREAHRAMISWEQRNAALPDPVTESDTDWDSTDWDSHDIPF